MNADPFNAMDCIELLMYEAAAHIASAVPDIKPRGACMLVEPPSSYQANGTGEVQVLGIGGSTVRVTRVSLPLRHHELFSCEIPRAAKDENFVAWAVKQARSHLASALPVALSWSFPLLRGRQVAAMGKNFSTAVVGEDVLELVNASLPPTIRAVSVTHDGVASLVAGVHADAACSFALTLGTGVNITLLSNGRFVNSEIGFLGNSEMLPCRLPLTPWDRSSAMPFENMVGGAAISALVEKMSTRPISTREAFSLAESFNCERDGVQLAAVASVMLKRSTEAVVPNLEQSAAAWFVAERAAALTAGALVGLAGPGAQGVYTGGVACNPYFQTRLVAWLARLSPEPVLLVPQPFGSEVGAGLHALAQLEQAQTSDK